MILLRLASVVSGVVAAAALAAGPDTARAVRASEDLKACLKTVTADSLLPSPSDPELYDYAACSELVTGRSDLCDGFPGGPRSLAAAPKAFTVVRSDGLTHKDTQYGVCISRAAGHRFLELLVRGAPEEQLLPPLQRMLYGEDLPVEEVLRASVDAWHTKSLKGSVRADLAGKGFFNYLLGQEACRKMKEGKLRQECFRKSSAIEALRAKDASLCLAGDFLCRELVEGPGVCRAIEERIVRRHCGAAPASPGKELDIAR